MPRRGARVQPNRLGEVFRGVRESPGRLQSSTGKQIDRRVLRLARDRRCRDLDGELRLVRLTVGHAQQAKGEPWSRIAMDRTQEIRHSVAAAATLDERGAHIVQCIDTRRVELSRPVQSDDRGVEVTCRQVRGAELRERFGIWKRFHDLGEV